MDTAAPRLAARLHRTRLARAERVCFGCFPFSRLLQAHTLSAAADAFVTVSFAGSLFFNVSVDAARPRVILALALTVAPFAVVASAIGPLIDRVRGGHRLAVGGACAVRAVLAWVLAGHLGSLAFYPLAFGVLVSGKAYSVAKSALVPRLVGERHELVGANSRLARLGFMAGAVSGAAALAALKLAGAITVVRIGAVVYLAAALAATRLPRPPPQAPVQRELEYEELHAPALVYSAAAIAAIRACVGFVTFLVGFALKERGEPAAFFALAVGAGALGGMAGAYVAPWLRRRLSEVRMIALALCLPAAAVLFVAAAFDRVSVLFLAAAVGCAANVGRQAFDSLVQVYAPDADRGRAFARYETAFQLSWVLGAVIPAALTPRPAVALGLLGAALAAAAAAYLRGARHALELTPAVGELRARVQAALAAEAGPLHAQLVEQADALAKAGASGPAVVTAAAAVEVQAQALGGEAYGRPEVNPAAALTRLAWTDLTGRAACVELSRLRDDAVAGRVGRAEAARAVVLARQLQGELDAQTARGASAAQAEAG
ncbi:MAG: MFS transporter [Acidimicrobiales bacterium]